MNKLASWLQVIGNFGIVIGIVLVLLQMQQNESLQRVEVLTEYANTYASSEWEKSFREPQNLTMAEGRILETQIWPPLLRWVNLHRQYEAGILRDQDWRLEVENDAGFFFASPYAQAWWENSGNFLLGSGYIPNDVYEVVQARIDASPNSNPLIDYEFIMERLRERNPDATNPVPE